MPRLPASFAAQTRKSGARHLRRLLGEFDSRVLEEGLVRRYLNRCCCEGLCNSELKRIAGDRSAGAGCVDECLSGFAIDDLEDLIGWFEVLVPVPVGEGGSRNPDAVFTPGWVAKMMADEAITVSRREGTVMDPSCGCGALLVAAFRRIWDLHVGERSASLAKRIIDTQLYGVDLDPDSVRRLKLVLALVAVEAGADNVDYEFSNFVSRDSLDLDAWCGRRFDVVIGNPPYIRYHQLSEVQRRDYRARFEVLSEGNFNLYFAFFELAHTLCADGGVVAFITPNDYFRAASAKPLRRWMVSEMPPTKVVDFGCARVFSAASTYTALTFADRNVSKRSLSYVDGFDEQNSPVAHMPAASKFSAIPFRDLDPAGVAWSLAGAQTRRFLRRIQLSGRPLLEVADVRFGAATLRDNLYLFDGSTDADGYFTTVYDSEVFRVEPAATVPAVKVPDVSTAAELRAHRGRILFPYSYDSDGKAVVWSAEELEQFPEAKRYLEAIRAELAKRDNGNKSYAAWFAYGRTQGLAAWRGERLLTPSYAAAPRFIRDVSRGRSRNRIFLNGCSVAPRPGSPVTVELLEALLNSTTLRFFVEQTSASLTGGFYDYRKGPLSRFSVLDEIISRSGEVLAVTGVERDELIADIYEVRLPDRYVTCSTTAC